MKRFSDRKIVLVTMKTRLEELIHRYNTVEQAQFYINSLGGDFDDYIIENQIYSSNLSLLISNLEVIGNLQVIERSFLPNFVFGKEDIVIALGRDGLVANTLKYLDGQPLLGVNPDPARWDGILLPIKVKECSRVVKDVILNHFKVKEATMAKVNLSDGQSLLAVNDFFIGQKTHISFRYQISHYNQSEFQSSSGIIISTGMGTTGWMKSILTGANNILKELTGKDYELYSKQDFSWGRNSLMYSVREPFASKSTGANIVFGEIKEDSPLIIRSETSENGVIFSDGIESDFLSFNAGMEARFELSDKKGRLVY